MTGPVEMEIRDATPKDAPAVAALHADSWRHNYRGAYSDSFLDGDVLSDREAVWSQRLSAEHDAAATGRLPVTATLVAHRPGSPSSLIGFAHVAFDVDPQWGSLLDNLHVAHELKRSGVGSRLIAEVAREVLDHSLRRGASRALHLYVLEQNTNAQAFYQARGGRFIESSFVSAPGGVASRLNGTPKRHLYAWDDASVLLPDQTGR